MSSFLRILRRATMFPSDWKRGTAKQTVAVEKTPKSVTSGNHNSKSNKKEFYPTGRGRLHINGAITDRDFENLHHRIDKLLAKLDDSDLDATQTEEEECVVCLAAKATMQTFPCGHKIVCRKCFIKTIQVAVSQRCLPLRCVICRSSILKVRQTSAHRKSKKPCQTSHASRLFGRAKSKKPPPRGK
ncbi:uncharacterized protein LOC125665829 isoform X1 [Ostrea edulis]|uniref:uncharacterized protein LOC125665829 isoform X1 n=1 Tax=Ostrea edulis TaxID=37623 RepID=UPI00209570A1|nr:uncharacterized protein LOC125665829 isoform X1 [Ostrea edulis]